METHGDFPDSATVLQIMKGVALPEVGLLWDAHHTCDVGKEKPADTFKAICSYVHHVHLKDSVPAAGADGIRYVMTGTGKIPVRETVRVLVKGGYRGYYNLEWEKTWIPDLEEPEIAFPQYAKTMSQYLADAGVQPACDTSFALCGWKAGCAAYAHNAAGALPCDPGVFLFVERVRCDVLASVKRELAIAAESARRSPSP